ncbi:HEAT repeat domain-containing protein [Candidatus Laterigemmans baculatus]|uniref:HEAT repeat domain-containing protein n=1 Tax=Candidatus Laterigemmans baculatus TaxID=2770505 RepID=UPI0013DB0A77|nr:HEAT repeat domain-containing protein [Candidatus Laterigemmans baculatus]
MDRIPDRHQFTAPQSTDRRAAVEFAAHQPEQCSRLAVPLVHATGDADDSVAMLAAEALEMLGPPPAAALPELVAVLDAAEDGEVVYWAVTLIGRLGPRGAAATESLTRTLSESPYLPVRERAAWALARIGTAAASAAAALRAAADGGPPRLTRLATQALESVRGMAA